MRKSISRRSALTVAGAGLASLAAAPTASASSAADPAVDATVADLVRLSEQSNAALMRGDVGAYFQMLTLDEDFTLMSPFGGAPSRSGAMTEAQKTALGRFFRNGTFRMELVQAYGSPDMVVLATIERSHVAVGGLPAQDWALRVTLVYRREAAQWRLAHRHADPLAPGVSLQQAAALARGAA